MVTSNEGIGSRAKAVFLILLALFSFIAASFFSYRYGLIAIPRGDDIGWILTRSSMKSDWDFFVYSMFRGRGDAYLFRPAFHFVLSTMDIFFRENLYAAGVLSVFLHGIASYLIYVLLRRLTGLLISLLLSVVFLTQLVGMEMVLWRHISWYMFGLCFFVMGLVLLVSSEEEGNWKKRRRLVTALFLSSSLFHESFAYTLLATGLIVAIFGKFWGTNERDGESGTDVARDAWVFLGPPLVYLVLNLTVAVCFMGRHGFAGSLGYLEHLKIHSIFQNILFLAGLFTTGFFLPHVLRLSFPAIGEKAELNFSAVPGPVCSALGFVLLICVAVGLLFVLLKWQRERCLSAVPCVALSMMFYLLILIFSVAVGRLTLRDVSYVKGSSYYFYFSNFTLLVLLGLILRALRRTGFLLKEGRSRAIDLLVLLFALFQIAWNYSGLQKILVLRYSQDKMVADANWEIASFFKKNPADCYGGSLVQWPSAISPNFLLFRERCSGGSERGLYVDRRAARDVWLSALPSVEGTRAVEFDETGSIPINFFMEPKVLGRYVSKSGTALMSKRSYKTAYYGARVETREAVGLVFGFRDPGNYVMLVVDEGNHFLMIVQNGQVSPASIDGKLPTTKETFDISVRAANNSFLVFCDQNVVAVIRGLDSLEGMVGVCDFRASPSGSPLEDVLISEDFSDSQSEPVFRLEKLSSSQQSSR